jgi:ribosomal protein S21
MNQDDLLSFEKIKLIRDDTTIKVFDNDVESASKHLRRRVLAAGILKGLRIRADNPKQSDRRKVKARRAASHRARFDRRRAEAARRDTS